MIIITLVMITTEKLFIYSEFFKLLFTIVICTKWLANNYDRIIVIINQPTNTNEQY